MPATVNLPTVDAHAASIEFEVVDGADLRSLEQEWMTLWHQCPDASPFATPGWLLAWAEHYRPRRFAAVVARRGSTLAGLVAVHVSRRRILLAGTGPSDFGDALVLPGCEGIVPQMLAALAEQVATGSSRRFDFRQLPPESVLAHAPTPHRWREQRTPDVVCPVLALAGAAGMDNLSARWRSNWRYALRRARREGAVVELAGIDSVANTLESLIELHGRCWRSRGRLGVFIDPRLANLVRDAGRSLAEQGLLRLHRLQSDEIVLAVLLAFTGHRQTHYYLSGFDPEFGQLSPGTILIGAAIEQAAIDGATAFHFLRGDEPYKYRWGAQDMPTQRRILTRTPA